MPETVLCEGSPSVVVDGVDGRLLLVVRDGDAIRFWMDTDQLDRALAGEPIQLSADGGFVRIEGRGEQVRLEYSLTGQGRYQCEVPASDVAAAIEIVRTARLREIDNPCVVVEDAA